MKIVFNGTSKVGKKCVALETEETAKVFADHPKMKHLDVAGAVSRAKTAKEKLQACGCV